VEKILLIFGLIAYISIVHSIYLVISVDPAIAAVAEGFVFVQQQTNKACSLTTTEEE